MRRTLHALLAATLLVSACQVEIPAARRVSGNKSTGSEEAKNILPVRSGQASNVNIASGSPTPKPSGLPSVAPTPSVPMKALTGLIKIDANYVIAAGGGSIIAAGGGNIIAAGGGNIIAAGGGNIIAAGGGNIIAAGGGNYRVLESLSVPVGTILPVRGMVVAPVSLLTGKLLGPSVVTDETGAYRVEVPESEANNIRLIAALPGKDLNDPIVQDSRLRYNLVVSASKKDEAQVLDEDTALVAKYLRRSFVSRLQEMLTTDDEEGLKTLITRWGIPAPMQQMFLAQIFSLRAEAKKIDVNGMSRADQDQLVQRVMDTILAHTPVEQIQSDPSLLPYYKVKGGPALPLMVDVLKFLRTRVTAQLAENPHYFDEQSFITTANAQEGLAKPYRVIKAADFGDFIVDEYLAKNVVIDPLTKEPIGPFTMLNRNLTSFGADVNPETGIIQSDQLEVCATCMIQEFAKTVFLNKENCKDEVIEVIRAFPQTKAVSDRVSI